MPAFPVPPPRRLWPESWRYLPGEIIDNKYRLEETLGEGGMGTVWIAHNMVLDVQVAIKIIRIGTPNSAERLLQEARASARLGHPAIVRVFDFGTSNHGDPFVVMELLHGETLAGAVKKSGRMPAIRAVQIMLPIAEALATAHAKGIIHRDVKPENIILAKHEDGRVQPKLLDFGIASFTETNTKLTQEGTVVGTPDYMSPEQARGDSDVDQRTDVWSFCVGLYELLTGKVPFSGKNYHSLLQAIINQAPTPLTAQAAGDEGLWHIIERGLDKRASNRWESMRKLGEALALWLFERGVQEDVCGGSLRTTWLESNPKLSPDADAPTTVTADGQEPYRELDVAARWKTAASGEAFEGELRVQPESDGAGVAIEVEQRGRRLRRRLSVAGVAVVLGVAGILAFASRQSEDPVSPASATERTAAASKDAVPAAAALPELEPDAPVEAPKVEEPIGMRQGDLEPGNRSEPSKSPASRASSDPEPVATPPASRQLQNQLSPTEPNAAKPGAAKPGAAKPSAVKPNEAKPGAAQLDAARPGKPAGSTDYDFGF